MSVVAGVSADAVIMKLPSVAALMVAPDKTSAPEIMVSDRGVHLSLAVNNATLCRADYVSLSAMIALYGA